MLSALFYILVAIHVFVCLFLIIVVLFQAGKEGMGGLLGVPGGSIENVHFHSRLNKVTTYVAAFFLLTTILIGVTSQYRQRIITGEEEPAVEEEVPVPEPMEPVEEMPEMEQPMPPTEEAPPEEGAPSIQLEEMPEGEQMPDEGAVVPVDPEEEGDMQPPTPSE